MVDPGSAARVAVPVVRGAGSWFLRRLRPDTSVPAQVRDADQLAADVRVREKPRLEQLGVLFDAELDNSLTRAVAADGNLVTSLSAAGEYYVEATKGRLVVLGDAGAGKTVLLLHLLLDLLRRREESVHGALRVPVRVNAANWDPSVNFTEWMARQIAQDYGVRRKVARASLNGERVLPVIDGLDEMDHGAARPSRAQRALEQLNSNPWKGRPVIISCRSERYNSIRDLRRARSARLESAATLTLRPLKSIEIVGYLDDQRNDKGIEREEWHPVYA